MTETNRQPWTDLYEHALLELDVSKLPQSIRVAEAAIGGRLYDLRHDSDHHAERRSMDDALRTLRILRRTESGQQTIHPQSD